MNRQTIRSGKPFGLADRTSEFRIAGEYELLPVSVALDGIRARRRDRGGCFGSPASQRAPGTRREVPARR